jgi:polyisoprenoid-binding protein YceI
MNRNRVLLAAAGLAVVLLVGGYLAYDQFLRGDSVAPLALPSAAASPPATAAGSPPGAGSARPAASGPATPATSAAASPASSGAVTPAGIAGSWTIGDGSVAGYRVREKLAGLPAESDAVGRTEDVTGEITLVESGGALVVDSGRIEVDLTTLASDDGRRDRRLREMAIETNRFPTTTFTLTSPVEVTAAALSGETIEVTLSGDLELHGVTKAVSIPAQARLVADEIEVAGSLTFAFADFSIEPPNIAGFVTVDDQGALEFLLTLRRA